MFGNAGREHMERYGSEPDHFAWIGWKNHKHSVNNPYAQFQDEYTLEEIKAREDDPRAADQAAVLADLRRLGAARSSPRERFVDEHDLWDQAVEIAGQAMVTDMPSTFEDAQLRSRSSATTCRRRRRERAYEEAGVGAEDVDVIELHDCFSRQRADHLRGARASPRRARATSWSRPRRRPTAARWVVNPSGGLISKGHPLGATGLAQCSELTWQLRGDADKRQVEGAKVALQHNIGLGGAAVVTVYRPPA